MLNFTDLALRRGPRLLLDKFSATINAGWRVGVVGRNGTGKTSLFGLILGEIPTDQGEVSLPRGLDIATVAQESPNTSRAVLDFVLDGDAELRRLEAQAEQAQANHDAHGLAQAHEGLHSIAGYAAPARASRLLRGLAFAQEDLERPVNSFSGGWRMRLNLARALMQRSDLLLLDEPTNHLDIDAVLWLQDWLRAYPGTLLIISHDREFLDAVTDHTLHLAQGTATLYSGNYSQFERLRAERLAQQGALAEQQRRQIAHLQSFVDRFKAKASKAKQAQARVKMIERITVLAPAMADSEFSFEFPAPSKLPSPLIKLDEAAAGYRLSDGNTRVVLSGLKLNLEPGDRIGLLGANGAGKSTFVRLLSADLLPHSGEVLRHNDLRIGYFAQHQLEQLDPAASPLSHLQRLDPKAGEAALRSFLGGFNFRGDRVFEPVAPFSGGEKARLALAMVVYLKPNLLLLDEPTNHLDLDMRQALELALQDFPGALVLVSHDRHLVDATCDTLWRVAGGQVQPFVGDLDDYAKWLASADRGPAGVLEAAPKPGASRSSGKEQRRAAADQRAQLKPLRDALKKAERAVEKHTARLSEITHEMADPDLYAADGKDRLTRLMSEQGELRKQLEAAEEAWMEASEALEAIDAT
ncbi:MAG: ATP-binding cassette domain-containing protein [Xanthomonadales bacterium]|nr:ATP-binding cassette domain-containing protein [Xanthomonadales bacterium]